MSGSGKKDIEQKLEELIVLLENSSVNSEDARRYRQRFDKAIDAYILPDDGVNPYIELDDKNLSRLDMLDELGKLLVTNPVDNETVRQHRKKELLTSTVVFIIGFTLMALGFAMIILPAPASFEIYTLFYFTPDDGVTIMDIISLLIILTAVFIIITAVKKKDR